MLSTPGVCSIDLTDSVDEAALPLSGDDAVLQRHLIPAIAARLGRALDAAAVTTQRTPGFIAIHNDKASSLVGSVASVQQTVCANVGATAAAVKFDGIAMHLLRCTIP